MVVDRLAVDAFAIRGVVFDLDGEVASDGLDKDGVEDVHMGMAAQDVVGTGGLGPLEVV